MPGINRYTSIAVVLILVLIGTFPVFAQVMKSDNYRLELEPGEIVPVEGFQGKTTEGKTDQSFAKDLKDKLLSSLSPDHPDFWKVILFIGIVVILIVLFAYTVTRNVLKKKLFSKQ